MKSLVLAFLALVLLAGIGTAAYAGHKECICEGDKCDEDCKNCDKCERCIHRKDCECGEVCVDDCKGCDKCGECLKKKRLDRRHRIAAHEAQRRRDRIHRRKIQPRIIITFGNGGIDRYRHHPNCRCNRCWWAVRYRPLRRQVDVFIHVRPRAQAHHDHHHHGRGRGERKLWHDGLRTRTDRPRFRR